MIFSVNTLQDKIIELLNSEEIKVTPLLTKEDLNLTGVDATTHIQYVGAKYSNKPRNYKSEFRIYVVHKTLSTTEKNSVYSILDYLRSKLIMMQIDYEKFVTKQFPATIVDENIAETKGNTFVYVFTVQFDTRI